MLTPSCAVLSTLELGASAFLGFLQLGESGLHATLAHRSDRDILVEFEVPIVGEPEPPEDLYPAIRQFIEAIEKTSTTAELCQVAANHIRQLTGFNRA
ncbi:hypothetical protein [Xanthomonas arboricola]|uniref:hypothetical protein n=1 Tax=Xanthomonas arboricola TaxID=56448 RepID=UPI001184B930|nr:hypothetical protein [Xanthomonas arboricola]